MWLMWNQSFVFINIHFKYQIITWYDIASIIFITLHRSMFKFYFRYFLFLIILQRRFLQHSCVTYLRIAIPIRVMVTTVWTWPRDLKPEKYDTRRCFASFHRLWCFAALYASVKTASSVDLHPLQIVSSIINVGPNYVFSEFPSRSHIK